MCMAIVPIEDQDSIVIAFAAETIYQRRNGRSDINLDVLVKNVCDRPIRRLRFWIPYSMVDIGSVTGLPSQAARHESNRLRELQQTYVSESSVSLLTDPSATRHNWPYANVFPTLRIDEGNRNSEGKFCLLSRGGKRVEGFVKRNWDLESPSEMTESVWVVCTAVNAMCVDFSCPHDMTEEHLKIGEAMWLRIHLDVPATGFNRKSFLERWFTRKLDYRQEFLSPGRVCSDIIKGVESFVPDHKLKENVKSELTIARSEAKKFAPRRGTVVWDWRTLLYRESGVSITNLVQPTPSTDIHYEVRAVNLPPAADPPGTRVWPRLSRLSRRDATVYYFRFGTDCGTQKDDDASIQVLTEVGNAVYVYLFWGFGLCAVVALILAVTCMVN